MKTCTSKPNSREKRVSARNTGNPAALPSDVATVGDLMRALSKLPPGVIPVYWGAYIRKADLRDMEAVEGKISRGQLVVAQAGQGSCEIVELRAAL